MLPEAGATDTNKKCPRCAMLIPAEARMCPWCHQKLYMGTGWKLLLALVFCSMVFYLAKDFMPGPKAQPGAIRIPAIESTPSQSPTSSQVADLQSRHLKYRVDGSLRQQITFTNKTGGTSQRTTSETPWEVEFSVPPGHHAYVSAQTQEENGFVTVKIYVDGKVWKSSDCDGDYCIADASGVVP